MRSAAFRPKAAGDGGVCCQATGDRCCGQGHVDRYAVDLCKGELYVDTVQVVDAAQACRIRHELYPTASAVLFVAMLGVMALQLSNPNAAVRSASEKLGMELQLESRVLNEAIEATAQFFKT